MEPRDDSLSDGCAPIIVIEFPAGAPNLRAFIPSFLNLHVFLPSLLSLYVFIPSILSLHVYIPPRFFPEEVSLSGPKKPCDETKQNKNCFSWKSDKSLSEIDTSLKSYWIGILVKSSYSCVSNWSKFYHHFCTFKILRRLVIKKK